MKTLMKTTAMALMLAGPASAGGLSETVMEPEVIEAEAAQGSRAGILVPVLALILIGIALSGSDDPAPTPEVVVDPGK